MESARLFDIAKDAEEFLSFESYDNNARVKFRMSNEQGSSIMRYEKASSGLYKDAVFAFAIGVKEGNDNSTPIVVRTYYYDQNGELIATDNAKKVSAQGEMNDVNHMYPGRYSATVIPQKIDFKRLAQSARREIESTELGIEDHDQIAFGMSSSPPSEEVCFSDGHCASIKEVMKEMATADIQIDDAAVGDKSPNIAPPPTQDNIERK